MGLQAYSTKYSEQEIKDSILELSKMDSFNKFIFMLKYGDMDDLIHSENGTDELNARKLMIQRISDVITEYGE